MARFYGMLNGGRGRSTRCGYAATGLNAVAASWNGAVRVGLYVDDDGRDCALVTIGQWHGAGPSPAVVLFDGPIAEAAAVLAARGEVTAPVGA